jgi:hypothetical protein
VDVAGQLDLGIGEHPPDTQILLDLDEGVADLNVDAHP